MAINREEAFTALGIDQDASREMIHRAFERLARRYPPNAFPDRFQRLIAARDLLLNDERYWRERFKSSTLDLVWAYSHLPKGALGGFKRPSDREFLQGLLRAIYQDIPVADPDYDPFTAANPG